MKKYIVTEEQLKNVHNWEIPVLDFEGLLEHFNLEEVDGPFIEKPSKKSLLERQTEATEKIASEIHYFNCTFVEGKWYQLLLRDIKRMFSTTKPEE